MQPENNRPERYGKTKIVLGPKDIFEGKLAVEGDLEIFGTVQGQVQVSGDISLQDGSTVMASVEASNISVRGNLEGEVSARGRLVIAGPGGVTGNVRVARLAVEDGASFNGNITMRAGSGMIETFEDSDVIPVPIGVVNGHRHN
ncbi:MAG: bactofilin family protein [Candidatus Dormibacteraceae bacterium]